ncbi:MAG: type VI secretion system-associated protein [Planctomycetota bacterium]|nr:MAG: type VI secretion system-associated protein [Planctomycetota bacterium]
MSTEHALARVHWEMGQTLLPEHFVAQEESLLAELRTRLRLLGLPSFGIATLRYNDALLADGTLQIRALTAVLPSGQLIDVPGNAVCNTLNLNVAGATRLAVFLHLVGGRLEEAAPSAGGGAGGGERIGRVLQRLELSPDPSVDASLYTMKLAEFVKDSEGTWSLSEDYLPPLLLVGSSPFLARTLEALGQLVEQFHFRLQQEVAASFLGGEGLFSAKLCLAGIYRFRRLLANLRAELRVHPYELYEALKAFYTDVCLYQDVSPEHVDRPYRHEQLAQCLDEVLQPLVRQVQVSRARSPYVSFQRKGGMFVIEELPPQVRGAKEIYFLIQKPRVAETLRLDGLKLASAQRLQVVHQLALQGIPIRRIERPPFQHQFGAEVEFYRLAEGEEWDHALRDGTLAFYERPELEGVRAHLYWRTG